MLRRGITTFRGIAATIGRGRALPRICTDPSTGSTGLSHADVVDVLSESTSEGSIGGNSIWKTQKFERNGLLWPSNSLEIARSVPVADGVPSDRLATLWSLSNSHGISWEELDQKFIDFHKKYIDQETKWVSGYEELWQEEYEKSEKALRKILKKTISDESQLSLTLSRRRGKIRRMTYSRISRTRFNEVLKPFQLRQFVSHMRAHVTEKMIKREINERLAGE
jgi:hypothetical protein